MKVPWKLLSWKLPCGSFHGSFRGSNFVEVFMEASVEVSSVDIASVEASVTFMEFSVEVNSLESSTKNFRRSFHLPRHGSLKASMEASMLPRKQWK